MSEPPVLSEHPHAGRLRASAPAGGGRAAADAARLRVALVGPTYPFKGGVAAHTTVLAHELTQAGHDVVLASWRHLYPSLLYPGEPQLPPGDADVEPFVRTTRPLSWARPDSWWRTGRLLREADVVIIVHVIPAMVPAHLAMIRAARGGATGPTVVALVHNVLPHESRPGDEPLMRRFFASVDAVLVHSGEQAEIARRLGATDLTIAELPPHLPGGAPLPWTPRQGPVSLLALGIVRDYKGLDLVLEALRQVPGLRLTIAGELWGSAGERVRALAADPGLALRVTLREGYVPAGDMAPLLAEHDALVLAYRSGTASQNVLLAHHHGLPVLVTDVGALAERVRDGVDGLVVPAGDEAALVAALRRLADRDTVDLLRHGVRPPDLTGPWARYVAAIETIAGVGEVGEQDPQDTQGDTEPPPGALARRARQTSAALASRVRGLADLARPETDLHSRDLPEWVRPTDVLLGPEQAQEVLTLARALGLPRARGGVAAWAALGAVAAVLRVRDGERRASVIVDASGAGSVFSRWVRAIGYAPVILDEAEHDISAGSLDVLTRLHPHGCTSEDVDAVLAQAARLLRRSGLVSLTLPVLTAGKAARPTSRAAVRARSRSRAAAAVTSADLRALVARADTLGLTLVGDVDRDIGPALSAGSGAGSPAASSRGPYALVRLTFRRR